MNTISNIHYACVIELINNDQDNASIGMTGGTIRYASDGIDLSSGYEYYGEDGDNIPVTETFYSDLVTKNGFSSMGSSIDITAGGNYAFLQNFNLKLANFTSTGRPYHKELGDEETYVVGGKVKVYTIIGNILYPSWTGVVTGITFDENDFTWNCADANTGDNNTINNTQFGLSKQIKIVVEDSTPKVIKTTPCTRLKIDNPYKDQNILILPDETGWAYDSMRPANSETVSTQYKFTNIEPYVPAPDGTRLGAPQSEYGYENYVTQGNDDHWQVWFYTPANFDISDMLYISLGRGEESDTNIYPIIAYDDAFTDRFGNTNMTRVLIKGECPLSVSEEQFGNYEEMFDPEKSVLDEFEGIVVKFYDKGAEVLEGIDVDAIYKLEDENGNEISKDLIVTNGTNDKHYLPFNTVSYVQEEIPNNKISIGYGFTSDFNSTDVDTAYTQSYNGKIDPPKFTPFLTDVKIDLEGISFDSSLYDRTYLGVVINKEEVSRTYDGVLMAYGTQYPEYNEHYPFAFYHFKDQEELGRFNQGTLTKRLPDGTTAQESVFNTTLDLQSSLCSLMNIDFGVMYKDEKYGLLLDRSINISSIEVPLGQYTSLNGVDTVNAILTINSDGAGTNLPVDLIPYRCVSSNSLSAGFYNPKIDEWAGGPEFSKMYGREFGFFADKKDVSEVLGDISNVINSADALVLKIYGVADYSTTFYYKNYQSTTYAPKRGFAIQPSERVIVPAYIDFSLVGQKNITHNEILGTIANDDATTGTETIGKVLASLSGSTTVSNIRPTYYVGQYINEQVDKYGVIATLCRQGFIGGYTNKNGDSIFKRIGEAESAVAHNNTNIIDKSIKNFKHTSIAKVYNEFDIKYNYTNNTPTGNITINKVDEDKFPDNPLIPGVGIYKPEEGGVDPNAFQFSDANTCTSSKIYFLEEVYDEYGFNFQFGDTFYIDIVPKDGAEYNGLNGKFEGTVIAVDRGYDSVIGANAVWITSNPTPATTLVIDNPDPAIVYPIGITLNNSSITETSLESSSNTLEWQKWVTGVKSYNDAKALWNKAHEAYLVTGSINKAPSNRTDLKWAVDRSWFYNSVEYDSTQEYAYDYLNKLLDWTSYQKLQVNYSLPITVSNLTDLDLLTTVNFSDPIITPDVGEFGQGWITKFEVNPRTDRIDVQLTFDPQYLRMSAGKVKICGDIIEDVNNEDSIVEHSIIATDNIIEGEC